MKRALVKTVSFVICILFVGMLAPGLAPAQRAVASNPWDAYNYAPASRTLTPSAVYTTHGTVSNATNLLTGGTTRLTGNGSYLALDFGKEVGGLVTLSFAGASDVNQSLGLAFAESSIYVGTSSDASNGGGGADGAIYAAVAGQGSYTMPASKLRGGFRYLTLFLNSSGWIDLNGVSLAFTAAPTMSNPQAYANHFYSNDALLNRIWYAGAYTVQMDTIAPNEGRVWGPPASGWDNSATVGVGSTILVDGAKRDRTVWPGDMGVAVPTAYVSTGDLLSTKNALTTLYNHQNTSTGELPYAGPEVNFYGSDTYHLWILIGTSAYYLYSGDKSWLDSIWTHYKSALTFSLNKVDSNGLFNVTGTADWARGGQGGENIEANALLYRSLMSGALLAQAEGDTTLASSYSGQAASLKVQINARLWDAGGGAYRDNPTSGTHPQDGNSLAVWFNVVDSQSKAQAIVSTLHGNWNSFGARTPEWGSNISPFPGSMEVQAHFQANDDQNGLDLIRREWGYMLNSSNGTGSSFWEGYNADGSFAYNGNYMSLAHGWSTGPTSALTFYVLGLAPDNVAGQSYHVIPHPGDLTHVEGSLALSAGHAVSVSYDRPACDSFSLTVDASGHSGSTGVLAVPRFGADRVVSINGSQAWNGSSFQGATGIGSADQDSSCIYFRGAQPARYTLSYTGGGCPTTTAYEAEAGGNTLSGQASIASCSGCSAGARVGWVGNGASNTLQFNAVNVATAGSYPLTIYYTNGDTLTRSADLSVNGAPAFTVGGFAPTANANTVASLLVTVHLNVGNNTLRFSNSAYWAPDFDRIALPTSPTISPLSSSTVNASFAPSNALDDNPGTSWSSQQRSGASAEEWFGVNLGMTHTLTGLSVTPRVVNGVGLSFPQTFSLQFSQDGTNWTTISGDSFTNYYTGAAPTQTQSWSFGTPVHAQYLRLDATQLGQDDFHNNYLQLAEFNVFASA